ncbi:MAG: DNA topoisomerase IA, partial [Edafosvirus sp.]
ENDKDTNHKKGNVAKITSESDTRKIMKLITQSVFTIDDISEKESLRHPSAPFTTSTLQQEASRKLGFSVKKTMTVAQSLYAAGYITYMRTDSVSLSDDAIENIKEYVLEKHGKDYYHKMQYKSKAKNTQEAHEAIRPTDANTVSIEDEVSPEENKLYNLIWKRAVASQMTAAKFKIMSIQINISKTDKYYFQTDIETLLFPGFLVVYNYSKNEDDDGKEDDALDNKNENIEISIPKKGSILDVTSVTATQEYQKPPTRYNEASLINKLDPKNLNIGRPSTYANIIEKIQLRKYVQKDSVDGIEKDVLTLTWNGKSDKLKESNKKKILGKETNKLVPTDMGATVTKFLIENFPNIMDYKFTAGIENKLDDIAKGKLIWHEVLNDFYTPFHSLVEKILHDFKESGGYVDMNAKILGKHPETNLDITASTGRHGPYVKMGNVSASIVKPLKLENIKLADAIKLLEYPKNLGNYKKNPVMLHKGKNGLYIKCGDTTSSIDNEDITIEEAIILIEDKQKNIKLEYSDEKKTYRVLIGKYGPYISAKDKIKNNTIFISIPKNENIDEMTKERIVEIIRDEATKYKKMKEKEDSQKEEVEKEKKSKKTKPKTKQKFKPKAKPKGKYKKINIV